MPGISTAYYSGMSLSEYYNNKEFFIENIKVTNLGDHRVIKGDFYKEELTTSHYITGTGQFYGDNHTYIQTNSFHDNVEPFYLSTGLVSGFAGTGLTYTELSGIRQSGVFGIEESGHFETGDNPYYYISESGNTERRLYTDLTARDEFIVNRSSISLVNSGEFKQLPQSVSPTISFEWDTFYPDGTPSTKTNQPGYVNDILGYKVYIQSKKDEVRGLGWKEITKTKFFTGFFLTGSGTSFAGTGKEYIYYVTGTNSGFGGQSGSQGNFTYVQIESGWAIKESGFQTNQNTYIHLDKEIYAVQESGFIVFPELQKNTSIDITSGMQNQLLSDNSTGFNIKIIGMDASSRTFSKEASITVIPPVISSAPTKKYARHFPSGKNYKFALTNSTIASPNEASDYTSALSIFENDPRGQYRLADWSDVTKEITGAEEYDQFMNVLGLTGQDMFFVSWQDTNKTYNNSNIYHWDRDWGDRSFWVEVGTGSIPSIVHDSADFSGDKRLTLSSYPDTLNALVYFPEFDDEITIREISSAATSGDKVTIPIESASCSSLKVYASSGKHFEPFNHTDSGVELILTEDNISGQVEFYLPPNRINSVESGFFYKIIPEDSYGTGQAAYVTGRTQTSARIRDFSVNEINPGADPEFQINWATYDYLNNRFENDYYSYAIQTFETPRDIPLTNKQFPIILDGETGLNHGLKDFFITGSPSGFAGLSGITGYNNGSGVSGELTYELYNTSLRSGVTGDIYGIVEYGFTTISKTSTEKISRNLFSSSDVDTLKYSLPGTNTNTLNLRVADLNLKSRELGFALFLFDSRQNVVETVIQTGSLTPASITGLSVDNSTSRSLNFGLNYSEGNIIKTEVFTGDSSSFVISSDNQIATLSSNQTLFSHEPRLTGQPPEIFSSTYYYKFLPYDNFGTGNLISTEAIVRVPNVDSPLLISQDAFETTGINGLDISEVFVRWTGDERIDRYDIEISEKQHPEKIIKSSVGSSDPQLRFNINHGDEHVINISGYLDYPDKVFTKTLKVLATGLESNDLKIRKDLNLSSENQKDFFINSSGFGLSGQAPYEVNLQLGSGNFIKSKKSSPGSISIVSTDIENESKELLFTNTSGFGTNLTGTVNITLGDSNKIASDGAGNISFQSTGDAGESKELFSITSDKSIPSVFKSDIELHMESGVYGSTGFKLQFGSFNHNSDPIFFSRYDVANESSQLRLYIGDNYGNSSDKFAIGAVAPGTTDFNSDFEPILTVAAHGGIGINKSGPTKALEVEKSSNSDSIVKIQNTNLYGGGVEIETETSQANSRPALKINGDFYIGASGSVILDYNKLPTSDPNVSGQIYRDSSNFLKISAG
tara:strand:+ start:23851 stop:27882 length:4032 start_codon:yes stop_codon:yes gene_type:complete